MKIVELIDKHPLLTGIVVLEILGILNTKINGRVQRDQQEQEQDTDAEA